MYPSHPCMFISLLTSVNLLPSLDPKNNIQIDRRNLSFKSRTMVKDFFVNDTHSEKLCFTQLVVEEFTEIEAWLVLTFFICLHN